MKHVLHHSFLSVSLSAKISHQNTKLWCCLAMWGNFYKANARRPFLVWEITVNISARAILSPTLSLRRDVAWMAIQMVWHLAQNVWRLRLLLFICSFCSKKMKFQVNLMLQIAVLLLWCLYFARQAPPVMARRVFVLFLIWKHVICSVWASSTAVKAPNLDLCLLLIISSLPCFCNSRKWISLIQQSLFVARRAKLRLFASIQHRFARSVDVCPQITTVQPSCGVLGPSWA